MTPIYDHYRPVLAAGVRLQTDTVSGEPILLYPEGVLYLNDTANEIVSRCDGTTSVGQMVAALVEEYQAESSGLRLDVVDCLNDLQQRKLVSFAK